MTIEDTEEKIYQKIKLEKRSNEEIIYKLVTDLAILSVRVNKLEMDAENNTEVPRRKG